MKRIDPKGEKFDHNFHQAVFEAEAPLCRRHLEVLTRLAATARCVRDGRRRQG
jgi:hypothetical protein